MRSVVGQAVVGDDFYGRDDGMARLLSRLAARRTGAGTS